MGDATRKMTRKMARKMVSMNQDLLFLSLWKPACEDICKLGIRPLPALPPSPPVGPPSLPGAAALRRKVGEGESTNKKVR